MNPINLICNNLSHSFYGKKIFKDVNLDLTAGNSLAITGKNGSGKSTLLKLIANLIRPSSGKVMIAKDGNSINKEDHFRYIGMSAPYINLYDELSGLENLEFFSSLKNSPINEIGVLLKNAGIYDSKDKILKNYSSGMKQRLKLCFSLLGSPDILLLDEPATNLDSEGTAFVKNMADEQKEKGILIIATNDPAEVELCASNINIEDYK